MWTPRLLLWLLGTTTLTLTLTARVVEAYDDSISAITASDDGQQVFAISRGQLLASEDGGYTWQRRMAKLSCVDVSCGTPDQLYLVASPNFANDRTIFFGSEKYGLRVSRDGGYNWLPLSDDSGNGNGNGNAPLMDACMGKGHFSLSPTFGSTDQLLMVVGKDISESEGWHQLYRSEDGGKSFSVIDLDNALPEGITNLQGCAALYSESALVHFLGTPNGALLGTSDGGKTWTHLWTMPEEDPEPIVRIAGEGAKLDWRHKQNYLIYVMTNHKLMAVTIHSIGDKLQVTGHSLVLEQSLEYHSDNFSNIVAHRGAQNAATSLLLMSSSPTASDCAMAAAAGEPQQEFCVTPAMLVSQDSGNGWTPIHAESLSKKRVTHDEMDEDLIFTSPYDPYNDAFGIPGTNTILLATAQGIFRSDDDGQKWKYLDTLSGQITGLSLGPSNGDGYYYLDFCTYGQGCFGGRVQIAAKENQAQALARSKTLQTPLGWENQDSSRDVYYEIVAVSPDHQQDAIVLRSTSRKSNAERLEKSHDNFQTTHHFVDIPLLPTFAGTVVTSVIHEIAFSPDFNNDKTIYVAGNGIGLAVSTDKADSFSFLHDPRNSNDDGTIIAIAFSPNFAQDNTMAILVDYNLYQQGEESMKHKNSAKVFLSRNRGQNFFAISEQTHQWTHLVSLQSKQDPSKCVLVAVHVDGKLRVWVDDFTNTNKNWEIIGGSSHMENFPDGYAPNGIVSKGGTLAASLEQGGIVIFQDFDLNSKRFQTQQLSNNRLYEDDVQSEDIKFAYHDDERKRGIGQVVAFSSQDNNVLVGCSYYSIYASFDQGINWVEVFRLPHKNHGRVATLPGEDTFHEGDATAAPLALDKNGHLVRGGNVVPHYMVVFIPMAAISIAILVCAYMYFKRQRELIFDDQGSYNFRDEYEQSLSKKI